MPLSEPVHPYIEGDPGISDYPLPGELESAGGRTRWLLTGIGDPALHQLSVEVTVDTMAPAVVWAIENAAHSNGITLTRL